jgi:hypothetical protein
VGMRKPATIQRAQGRGRKRGADEAKCGTALTDCGAWFRGSTAADCAKRHLTLDLTLRSHSMLYTFFLRLYRTGGEEASPLDFGKR